MRPPCRDARTSLERLRAESREQVGREEHRRRECAIGQRELGAACEAAVSDDLLKLIEPVLELGNLFADDLFVASLRIHLSEQRAQRWLEIEVVEAGDDSHLRAALGALRQQRRSWELVFQVLVDDFGFGNQQSVRIGRWSLSEYVH